MFIKHLLNRVREKAFKNKTIFIITVVLVIVFISLEIFLSMKYSATRNAMERTVFGEYKLDPIYGWKNKSGKWSEWNDYKCEISFYDDGTRATSRKKRTNKKYIVLIGGSITQGYGLPDKDTFAWQLQSMNPDIDFYNYGTAGYGTYQSYILLQDILVKEEPPLFVFYGFIPHHEERNIASCEWLNYLILFNRKNFSLPYCTIDNKGNLIERTLYSTSEIPLRVFEFFYVKVQLFKALKRERYSKEVTEKLFLKMRDLCKDNGTELVVLVYHGYLEKNLFGYNEFLKRHNIKTVECPVKNKNWAKLGRTDLMGHPNAYLHSYWASYINEFIKKSR